jgi:hypothetical protein
MNTAKLAVVTGTVPRHWQDALNEYLGAKFHGSNKVKSRRTWT